MFRMPGLKRPEGTRAPALRTNSEASDEGMLVLNAWNGPESAIIGPFLRSGTLPALFWRRCVARSEARSPPAGVLPIRGEMDGEDFYSVEQAADTLELTPGRVRQMLRAGDLEGIPPGERRGEAELGGRGWRVSRESVEALLRRRPPRPEPTETPETATTGADGDSGDGRPRRAGRAPARPGELSTGPARPGESGPLRS